MSRIVTLGEHKWQLPPEPGSQDEVLFVKENKDNQYWRRSVDEYPDYFFNWNSLTKLNQEFTRYDEDGLLRELSREHSKKFIYLRDRELQRRINGVWMMNNGQLTYLTGGHYFVLQWGAMAGYTNPDDGTPYGRYMEFQADLAYFLQMCKEDNDSVGGFIVKPKKTGVTQYLALDFLDESTRLRGRTFGMMSKAQVPDCRDTNFMYYLNALDQLPNCMKPSESNRNLTSIIFGKAKQRATGTLASVIKAQGNNEGLNTRVFAAATKANGFDGPKMFRGWHDEFPKYEDPYPEEVWSKTQDTVKMQEEIYGKLWLSSYAPEDDKKNFKQARKIYYDSKLKTRGKNGRTKTELYVHFISTLDSAAGSFDRFGRADRQKTTVYIQNKQEQLKNDRNELQGFTRRNPVIEDDVWRIGGGSGSIWDNIRLGLRLNIVEDMLRRADLPYIEGEFHWLDPKKRTSIITEEARRAGGNIGGYSPVYFKELTDDERKAGREGIFRIYKPEWLKHKYRYNVPIIDDNRKKGNKLIGPRMDTDFIASLDPTNYAMKKQVLTGSLNSAWVFNFPDSAVDTYHGQKVTKRPVCEYLYRREKPKDTYEDIIKMVLYFGCYILIEGNMPWVITKMIEEGLENFIMVREKGGAIVPYDANEHSTLVSSVRGKGKDTVDDYVRAIGNYIGEPEHEDEFDYMDLIYSERFLQQAMEFDNDDTKAFDSVVGFGWGVVAMNAFLALRQKLLDKERRYGKEAMSALFNEFVD